MPASDPVAARTIEDVLAQLAPFSDLSPELIRTYVLVGEELWFPAGAKLITITTRARAETVAVEVADDGPGVPEDVRDRVFDPFFTTRAVGDGAGLGLDVARRIVAGRHHGELRLLDPVPGRTGARFEVVLPVAAPGT